MPVNDFDRGLLEKFEGHDFEYNPAGWERLSAQLSDAPVKRRRVLWLPLTGVAAAVVLALSIPFVWQHRAAQDPAVARAVRSSNKPVVRTVPASPQPAPAALPVASVAPAAAHAASSSPVVSSAPYIQPPIAVNTTPIAAAPEAAPASVSDPVAHPVLPDLNVAPGGMSLPSAAPGNYAVIQAPKTSPAPSPYPAAAAPVVDLSRRQDRYLSIDPDELSYNAQSRRKVNLSLAGGYNQGTSNAGYMVGVNTRRNLGSKVYVEGDVAFAASRNTQQTLAMPSDNFDAFTQNAPQGFLANAKSASSTETVNQLYYLQVTPVVGYQVFKNWSVGAGADVQRLFQDGEKKSFVVDDGVAKSMPTMDLGVVGKTEYTVYRNFKAGLQYRYGMNGVLDPGKNYVNRSYLQVQLKVGILGNK